MLGLLGFCSHNILGEEKIEGELESWTSWRNGVMMSALSSSNQWIGSSKRSMSRHLVGYVRQGGNLGENTFALQRWQCISKQFCNTKAKNPGEILAKGSIDRLINFKIEQTMQRLIEQLTKQLIAQKRPFFSDKKNSHSKTRAREKNYEFELVDWLSMDSPRRNINTLGLALWVVQQDWDQDFHSPEKNKIFAEFSFHMSTNQKRWAKILPKSISVCVWCLPIWS